MSFPGDFPGVTSFDARKQMDTFQQTIEKLCLGALSQCQIHCASGYVTVIVIIVVEHVNQILKICVSYGAT